MGVMGHRLKSAVLAACIGSSALAGCGGRAETDPRTLAPLVRTATAAATDGAGDNLTGVVHARTESDLGFRAGGKIAARLVDPGQHVRKGQALMTLDVQDYALGAAAAEAQYAAAKAQADRATADEQRLRGLVASGAISAQAYDQAKAGAASAVDQAGAALAQRDIARRQAGFATLTADADGVVMSLSADVGVVVAAGQPVLRLAHDGPREAVVNLAESRRATAPHSATAVLLDGAGGAVPATLRQLSAAADPLTRTYEARYVLGATGAQAPLGSTVTVLLSGAHGASGVSVPLAALVDRGAGAAVMVVDPATKHVHRRPVTVASLSEETAVLSAGLQPGEPVAALGAALLHDGQAVRIEPRP